jgi:hypothetical protein
MASRLGVVDALVAAAGTITGDTETGIANNDVLIIAGFTYAFSALPFDASSVLFESADITVNLENLVKAINGTGVEGVDYGANHPGIPNPDVKAEQSGDVVTITSRVAGHVGNHITLVESTEDCSLSGAKLTGGEGRLGKAIAKIRSFCQVNAEVLTLLDYIQVGG